MKNIITRACALFLIVTVTVTIAPPPLHGETPHAQAAGKPQQQFAPPEEAPDGLTKSDWAGIRAAYEAGRHAFHPTESGWRARNPGQQWITTFDKRGFVAEPSHGDWTWGLELTGYGFAGAERPVGGVPSVRAEGQRLTYAWDKTVQEWFVNDTRGLEHGFTVMERPKDGEGQTTPSPLCFTLAVRGSLSARVAADGQDVAFREASGATVLTYAGLKVWDADGRELAARFAPVEDSAPGTLRLEVEESGARYPLTIDPIAQQAYLKASNTEAIDLFGTSVAVSGDTVVVGAAAEDSKATGVNATGMNGDQADNTASGSGAAYVFTRSGTTWTQQAYLKASNTGGLDLFGSSVAISGDTLVVGALFEDSNATGVDGNGADNSAEDSGAAYVFTRSGTTWTQQAYLKASNTGASDRFGDSVAVSGDTVVVGALLESSNATGVNSGGGADNSALNAGAAYVFTRSGTTWTQQAYLKASNTAVFDQFGNSVAVSGDTVVVGADGEDSNATGVNGDQADNTASGSGAAYIFTRSGTAWTQQAYLKASNTGANDSFGESVAVSGDAVVVGAFNEGSNATGVNGDQADNTASGSGAAYVFTRSGTTWTQHAYLKASNTGGGDSFGESVAVSGDTVVVGALRESSNATGVNSSGGANNSAFAAGAAYVFMRSGTTWTQEAYLKASNTEAGDFFGESVAVSGDTVVVGASLESSNATGVNGDGADNSADKSGAAYVFLLPVPEPMPDPGPGDPDLNSDGFGDLILQGPGGDVIFLYLKGSTAFTGSDIEAFISATAGYEMVATGDMNKDGFTDLVLQGPAGDVVFIYLKGTTAFTSSDVAVLTPSTGGYAVAGAGDMNKDGCTDLIFQGPGGDVVFLYLKGTTAFTGSDIAVLTPATGGYSVAGVADMNKDGCADLVFQGPSGDVVFLYLKGSTTFTGSDVAVLTPATGGYAVKGAADMNKDGCGDLIFQGPGGDVLFLYLKGTTAFTGSDIETLTPGAGGYEVVAP